MEDYDPERALDPEQWTALDEDERHYLVERYHRKKRIKLPNRRVHAAFHVIVENQIALGDEIPVRKTLARLVRQGLFRHDAVHAIASVLSGCMFDLLKHGAKDEDLSVEYYRRLEKLTAEAWLKSAEEPEGQEP